MSQCVPSWDFDNNNPSRLNILAPSNSANSLPLDVPSLDYEQVAELTWKNGQLTMHGLAAPRLPAPTKPPPAATPTTTYTTWDKPRAGGTLESLVKQATSHHPKPTANYNITVNELAPWFDHYRAASSSATAATAADALVPCSNGINISNNNITKSSNLTQSQEKKENSPHVLGCSACVGSSSSGAGGICRCGASESATRSRRPVPVDRGYREPTSTSQWSPENTSSGGEYTRTSAEDLDYSVGHNRSQAIGIGGDRKRKAAAIHNQSERKRRDKINQRMKTLQKMVPNSSKTDKASMLDEVIEYLKQLQAQVHMMSRMSMASPLMLMQQQLQMSMMAPMGMMPPVIPPAGGFVPVPSWDMHGSDRPVMPDLMSAYLACQTQPNPMAIDAYNRMALYQQFQHQHPPGPKN